MKTAKLGILAVVLLAFGCAGQQSSRLTRSIYELPVCYQIDAAGVVTGQDCRACSTYDTFEALSAGLDRQLELLALDEQMLAKRGNMLVDKVVEHSIYSRTLETIYCLKRYDKYIPAGHKIRTYFKKEVELRERFAQLGLQISTAMKDKPTETTAH
jgi:hypothetical protein